MLRVARDEMTRARTLDNRTGVEISSMDSLFSSRASLNSGLQIIPDSMPKLRYFVQIPNTQWEKSFPTAHSSFAQAQNNPQQSSNK